MRDIFPVMNPLRRLADHTAPDSLASKLRRQRLQLFKALISAVDNMPLTILDVGGTLHFSKRTDFLAEGRQLELTLLNLFKTETHYPNVPTVVGDARHMKEFRDRQFDVVFSNSVIEHVGDFPQQKRMADEIRRVGNAYFVQTPNLYFPIEPHFLFPFFQFLPLRLRAFLLTYFSIGWHGPAGHIRKARNTVSSVRLLTGPQLARLFPDGQIYRERLFGLTKSFVALRPWSMERQRSARRRSLSEGHAAPTPDGARRNA